MKNEKMAVVIPNETKLVESWDGKSWKHLNIDDIMTGQWILQEYPEEKGGNACDVSPMHPDADID